MLDRLEQFQRFEKKKKMQDVVINAKKLTAIQANEEGCDADTKNALVEEVKAAQRTKDEIIQEEINERRILEDELMQMDLDDRIRTIFMLHYLQGMTLKDVAVQIGLSYDYTRELASNGRKLLR